MIFKSKIDAWLIVIIAAGLLAAPVLLIVMPNAPRHPPMSDGALFTIVGIVTLGPGAFIAWIFLNTDYTVTATDLLVRAGPLAQTIPLASITKIRATHSILSAPALSLDRMEIQYGKFGSIVISPEDKAGFVQAIRAGVPGVTVEGVDL